MDALVNAVKSAEAANGGPKKSWPVQNTQRLRNAYEALLKTYPWLHGYWIRYARVEFKLGSVDMAVQVYERALKPLRYSAPLWASYLSFLIETNGSNIESLFQTAQTLIGRQFLSHEFWHLYIQWKQEIGNDYYGSIEPLLFILLHTSIHQYAVFYGQLVRLARDAPLTYFASIQFEHAFGLEETNENRTALLATLMKLFRDQQKRVAEAYVYEKRIHRQFFDPSHPLTDADIGAWTDAIAASNYPEIVYQRALIPAALNEQTWLGYARWLVANQPESVASTLDTSPALVKIRIYLALWLESQNLVEDARTVYESLGLTSADVVVEYSWFLKRQGQDPASVLRQALQAKQLDDETRVLSELSKYSATAFKDFSHPESAQYWLAYLKARPDLADEIWEQAPEGAVTVPYLELLARTNVARFVELDRQLNRSAFAA